MGFRTWVRLPSGPLQREVANPIQGTSLHVFRNVCAHVLYVDWESMHKDADAEARLSFGNIRKWVLDVHGIKVSNGSISQVMKKCGIERLDDEGAELSIELKSEKEKLVYEAFKHFNVVSNLS